MASDERERVFRVCAPPDLPDARDRLQKPAQTRTSCTLRPLFGPIGAIDAVVADYRVHGANAYEQSTTSIDLAHVRESIRLGEVTRRHMHPLALGLELDAELTRTASFSEVANRAVSLRLDRSQHRLGGDSRVRLLKDGWRAATQRSDVAAPMRALLFTWLSVCLLSPRVVARWLAELFFFPERRARLNGVLRRFHGGRLGRRPTAVGNVRGASS